MFKNIIIYFLTGGLFTTFIVLSENSDHRLISGLATLIPVFTLVSYIFIGQTGGGLAVSRHATFVLIGTILSWVPYMIAVIYFAPRMNPYKAIALGMIIFFVLATIYVFLSGHFGWFKS